jgi:ferrochelatase
VRWTGPYLDDELGRLCASRAPIVVMPLSFVADCLETLYDLDVVARATATKAAVSSFVRAPAFNDDPRFVAALATVVLRRLERPAPSQRPMVKK